MMTETVACSSLPRFLTWKSRIDVWRSSRGILRFVEFSVNLAQAALTSVQIVDIVKQFGKSVKLG